MLEINRVKLKGTTIYKFEFIDLFKELETGELKDETP
jgi:hypothetical protein